MNRINILHVANLNSYGGIQKLAIQLVEELNNCSRIHNSLLSTKNLDLLKSSLPDNLNVLQLNGHGYFIKLRALIKIMKSYDIIHFHGPYTLYQFAALFVKSKIVYTEHGTLQRSNIKNTIKHLVQKRIMGLIYLKLKVDTIIFVSKWIKNDLNIKKTNTYVIYNGLKEEKASIVDLSTSDTISLSIVARLVPRKRVHLAIEIMHLLKENKSIRLNVIGTGNEIEYLKEIAGELINETVFFLGYRSDALDLIGASDFYLMTTVNEPFGLVVLEAMMNETVVLALNDSGGPVEILEEQFPFLLGRDAETLASKVLMFSENQSFKEQIAKELKQLYYEKYTINRMANQYIEVYLKTSKNEK